MTGKTGAQRQAEYRKRKAQEGLKDITMQLDQPTRTGLNVLAQHYGTDLPGTVARLTAQAVERLRNPTAAQRDPSPLHHGEDTRRLVQRLLTEAGGDRKLAKKLLLEDIRRRYPGFKAVPGAPGFLEFDRCRRKL